ncbi:MAG: HdeD family acid-resistance protein [Legionella sp.]|nr:MAG: HdeD family acid-resistance protein [Legionella sp.]
MESSPIINSPIVKDAKHNWGWILGLGILYLVLGCIGLGMEVALTLVSMYFFSAFLIICGIMNLVDVFKHRGWKGVLGHFLIAILYFAAAGVIAYDPFLASTFITAMLAGVLMVIGITRMLMAFSLRDSKGWGWLFFAGLCALVLGILIMAQWPISGLWVIGMFIAIEMIISGWTYIVIALSVRQS